MSGLLATGGSPVHRKFYRIGHVVGFKGRLGWPGFWWWEGRGKAAFGSFGWGRGGKVNGCLKQMW